MDFEADLRKTKQDYLVEHVVNPGYDTNSFTEFMNYKKGKGFQFELTECIEDGANVDNWTMDELIVAVGDFHTWYNQGYQEQDGCKSFLYCTYYKNDNRAIVANGQQRTIRW